MRWRTCRGRWRSTWPDGLIYELAVEDIILKFAVRRNLVYLYGYHSTLGLGT